MAGLHVPCRRFADTLADACARLGADVVRYSVNVGDYHPLLLAGLPAHLYENSQSAISRNIDLSERAVFDYFRARKGKKTPENEMAVCFQVYIPET
jgi:hypothetical protein